MNLNTRMKCIGFHPDCAITIPITLQIVNALCNYNAINKYKQFSLLVVRDHYIWRSIVSTQIIKS